MKHLNRFRLNEEVKSGWEKIDYDGAGRFLDGVLSISGITTREDKISPKLLTQIYGLFSDTNNMEYKILVGSSFLGPHNTPQMWNRKDPSSNAMRIDLYKGDIHIFPYDDEWFLEILNENLKYDLEYLRESMELVIDSYKFMGLFCRIHNNFIANNNKELYKEGFNKLFDKFFYRIKRKKEDASYYLNYYLDNKKLLVNFMNNCNR